MNTRINLIVAATFLLGGSQLFAQSAGSSVSLQYGTVKAVETVQAQSRHARGAVLGGIGGAVLAHGHPDMVVGDCVVVEQGQYANIRRVSSINCQVKQQPEHHVSAANNCQKAKDELNMAKDKAAVENAVIKVRTLCED